MLNVTEYINNVRENIEDTKKLLKYFIEITESQGGAIFIKKYDTNDFLCDEHIYPSEEKAETSFKLSSNNNGFKKMSGFYTAPYKINTILNIHLTIKENIIGVICLVNRIDEYDNQIIEYLSPLITIATLVINNKKLSRELSNKTNSSDLFIANMSHEIRTPANGVIGYGQLLLNTDLSTTQKNYLYAQNQCCVQLMQIINDILDYSKLSSGNMSVSEECFSIAEIIETLRGVVNTRIQEKRQKLQFKILDNQDDKFIVTDKQKLIQILVNLISNSNKFTDISGFIEVNFKYIESNKLQISVKDNGIGISVEDQKKIFIPFQEIEANFCKSGSGLGLVISQKLAKILNGNITFDSTVGLGSTFIVNITYKPYQDYEKNIDYDINLLKNKSVICVDDNADNRILLSNILFEWNMKPVVCASALEALSMILGNRYEFSLGLIDICMPGISGSDLAKQIKEERPLFPLIALSSLDNFITTKDFELKLNKPINKIQLFNAIYNVLKKHNPSAYIGDEKHDVHENIYYTPYTCFDKNVKILIAEDISYNKVLLDNMLKNIGYNNLFFAENGQQTINMIEKSYTDNDIFDILLLDLKMPIVDGYKVIEHIRNKKLKLPKIVVVTASVNDNVRNYCKKMDIRYFIEKPIDLAQLREVMLYKVKDLHKTDTVKQ